MVSLKSFQEWGEGEIKEDDGGQFNYGVFDML
jgi:hypothetical protein